MGALDFITSSAVSLTVSGNSGISPFLTLFLLGIIEQSDPSLLKMEGWIETLLSHWASLGILGVLTGLELLGKCIPVIDEIIDSVEVFIVPVLSVLASMGTLGLLDWAETKSELEDLVEEAQHQSSQEKEHGGEANDQRRRRLSVADGFLTFIKVILVAIGIVLAVLIHFCKMLVRVLGLACCAGCCHPCITILEVTCVLTGVLLAVFIREIAIFTCAILLGAAGWTVWKKFYEKKDESGEGEGGSNNANDNNSVNPQQSTNTTTPTKAKPSPTKTDVESPPPPMAQAEIVEEATPPPATNPDFVSVQVTQSITSTPKSRNEDDTTRCNDKTEEETEEAEAVEVTLNK